MPDDIELTSAPTFDSARFRQVMGHFCTGITIVTAMDGEQPVGFTAQSFTSVSLDPPLVLLCPGKASSTWPRIKEAGRFCVNILADDQEALCRAFATSGADKFKGVGWKPGPRSGAPVLDDVLAWADCELTAEHDAGDHTIAVGQVLDLGVRDHAGPLLFFRGGYGSFEA